MSAQTDPTRLSTNLFERFEQELRLRRYARRTIKMYTSAQRSFVTWLGPRHPREADAETVRA